MVVQDCTRWPLMVVQDCTRWPESAPLRLFVSTEGKSTKDKARERL